MLLSAEHLSINFGSRQLLDDVNFYLNEGDKVGVIGINGTGKSTFLKVLSGVTEPDGGTISRNPNVQVSLLPQNPAMEESATVLEQVFLHFPAEFRELNEYEAKAMLNRLGITDFAQKVGTLSGGQRKRVALAAALIHPADVLILDEPTNHLDAEMTRQGLNELDLAQLDLVILENVGNLVCPAEFDTGAVKNAVILSVPEGDDKPLKYPLMFTVADVLLVNKIDAAACFDFDLELFTQRVHALRPGIPIFPISAKTGEGVEAWCNWLREQVQQWQES